MPLRVFCAMRLFAIHNRLLEVEWTPSPSHSMTSHSCIASSSQSQAETPNEVDLCIRVRVSWARAFGHTFNPAPSNWQSMSSTRAPFRHSTRASEPVDVPLKDKVTCRRVKVVFSPFTTIPGSCKTGGRMEPADASRSMLEVTASLWFCDNSPRGSCSACFPLLCASTINFVMGKSGGATGGATFLARATSCSSRGLFLAFAFGFLAAFMAGKEASVLVWWLILLGIDWHCIKVESNRQKHWIYLPNQYFQINYSSCSFIVTTITYHIKWNCHGFFCGQVQETLVEDDTHMYRTGFGPKAAGDDYYHFELASTVLSLLLLPLKPMTWQHRKRATLWPPTNCRTMDMRLAVLWLSERESKYSTAKARTAFHASRRDDDSILQGWLAATGGAKQNPVSSGALTLYWHSEMRTVGRLWSFLHICLHMFALLWWMKEP